MGDGGEILNFLSWSLNAPTNAEFNRYMEKVNGQWVIKDPEAIHTWADARKDMFIMFEKYHDKITAFGLHDFGVNPDGSIYDYTTETRDENNNRIGTKVLNENGQVVRWVKNSLQYLMETYPHIRYSIQLINMQGEGESKVDGFLDDVAKWDVCISETKKVAEQYIARFPMIKDIEVDFERAYHREGDEIKFRDFLVRMKNEVCIPLGLGLRVNLYAMTGDFVPNYYAWHDYKTLASAKDKKGNRAIDEFQLMTYDFSYADSAPGPSTPIWWLERVLEHVKNSLPVEDTWIGNAGYGRRWGLDNKQRGRVVTYKQLVMWQNGMYIHNHQDGNSWIWHKQDWLPFVGWHDEGSGYEITYPHLYDRFDASMSTDTGKGTVNRTTYGGKSIITSYFKSQQPEFTGIQAILNEPTETSGNVSEIYKANGVMIPAEYLGKDTTFPSAKRANRAVYLYDSGSNSCVRAKDETGTNGYIRFDFNVAQAGKYKLIALVHFNTFVNNEINARLNGQALVIGGDNLVEWWPFYVDKYAWLEVGEFDFLTENVLEILPSSGYIWGFVVCKDFKQNFLGGEVEFNAFIAPFMKRGEMDEQGNIEKVIADLPEKFTLTGEILRRPPRPAIIFEDTFNHYLNRADVQEAIREQGYYDVKSEAYYMGIQQAYNSGPNVGKLGNRNVCTDEKGVQTIGFSDGVWRLEADGVVRATVNVGYSNQLVLHKKFRCNIQVRADIAVSGTYPYGGIRFLASEEGNGNQGYIAVLDYSMNRVSIVYEDGKGGWDELTYAWMSDQLVGLKGQTVTMTVSVWNGKVWVKVGDKLYIDGFELPYKPDSGAYGVFVKSGSITLSFLNISTLDRYEPLEKLKVEMDGQEYVFGEVPRTVEYDEFGYLIYSGLDVESTNVNETKWSLDYINEPLAIVPSWEGRKKIRVQMLDAGIWLSFFYIGDTEGYSVAYNSDLSGFITTSLLIHRYGCRGVAMWTIGQEDPLVFTYLPPPR